MWIFRPRMEAIRISLLEQMHALIKRWSGLPVKCHYSWNLDMYICCFFFNIMFVLIHVTDLLPFVCCLFFYSLIHMNLSMDDGGRSVQQQWRSNVLAFTSPAVVVSTPVGTSIGQNGIIFRPTVWESTSKRNYLKFHLLYAKRTTSRSWKPGHICNSTTSTTI